MLQEWFGEPLYRRSGHGIALTEAGERLAEQARQLRQVYRQAQAVRESWRGLETGVLRLGASTTPASYLLPRLVAEFRQAFPAVSLHLSDGNTREIVERLPVLDLAFIEGDVPAGLPADTAVHAWRQDEVVAIVRADHALSGKGAVTLRDLAASPLVMREPGSGCGGWSSALRRCRPYAVGGVGTGGRGRGEAGGARRIGRGLRVGDVDAA